MRGASGLVVGVLVWCALGCGARTDLRQPDAQPPDGSTDVDAGPSPPDAADSAPMPMCGDADVTVRFEDDGTPAPDRVPLSTRTGVPQADVYFLMDTTGSMAGEIRAMREAVVELIETLTCPASGPRCSADGDCADDERCSPEGRCGPAPEVAGCLPDLHVGIGRYAGTSDSYRHLFDVGPVSPATREAIPSSADGAGGREALYQSVSCVVGAGRCPSPGCASTGRGCGGFRERALPIVVALTDEGDECTFAGRFRDCVATHEDAGRRLRRFGARFVGIDADVDREATPFLVALSEEAESFDADGEPMVYPGSEGDVVDAVRTGLVAVSRSPLRLSLRLVDEEGDGGDAAAFVDHVAVDTTSPGCFAYEETEDTDGDGRPDVVPAAGPGTRGCFEVVPRAISPADRDAMPRALRLRAELRAGGGVAEARSICFAVR